MNDPWADVRKKRNRRYMKTPWTDPELDRLLADADALLELRDTVKEIGEGEEYYMGRESANDYDATIEAICEQLRNALAALPEHLRGVTNERSRKA